MENAQSGLDVLASDGTIDVVLTDLVLPGLSGRGLVDRVRETGSKVPFVLMSGYIGGSADHPETLPPDVVFLQKPFTPDELLAAVRTALSVT